MHEIKTTQYFFRFIVVLAAIVFFNSLFQGKKILKQRRELNEGHTQLTNQVKALQKRQQEIENEIIKLKKSPNYARKILKDRYHAKEPGEQIVFFNQDTKTLEAK